MRASHSGASVRVLAAAAVVNEDVDQLWLCTVDAIQEGEAFIEERGRKTVLLAARKH